MVTSLVAFALFVFFQSEGMVIGTEGEHTIFLYLVPITALVGYFGSQIIFKRLLSKILPSHPTSIKIAKYKTASVIKFAMIEAPTLLALVAYYLTNNALHLVIGFCLAAYLLVQRPNTSRFTSDVQWNFEEKKQIDTLNH